MRRCIKEVVTSVKYLVNCFRKSKGPHEVVEKNCVKECKNFRANEKMCHVRSVSLGVDREFQGSSTHLRLCYSIS